MANAAFRYAERYGDIGALAPSKAVVEIGKGKSAHQLRRTLHQRLLQLGATNKGFSRLLRSYGLSSKPRSG